MAVAAVLPGFASTPLAAASPAKSAALSPEQGTTAALLHVAFPHPGLDAGFYAGVATTYLDEIAGKPAFDEHQRGLALLDGSHIAPFSQLPGVIQRSMVARYDQEPFFKALLGRGAELIYRDRKVWDLLGYEGSSVEYGGYIERGFDDIDWLPAEGGVQ
jgi:hypothetical protein